MLIANMPTGPDTKNASAAEGVGQTVATLLYEEEFEQLLTIYNSKDNERPRFAFPDLISSCISLTFDAHVNPSLPIFEFVRTNLSLRNCTGNQKRRKEDIWRAQYALLRSLQLSRENQYPNPKFDLGDLTSACVALAVSMPDAPNTILSQARRNSAQRERAREKLKK